MVYRGQPSKACLQCRKRKLRCDLQKESCSQCVRANLVCFGYRDTGQLQIRDESQTTKQKALACRSGSISPTLTTAIDITARDVFFYYYVSGLTNTYDVLEPLYSRSTPDSYLTASVQAASLAFFSFKFCCAKAAHTAREKYLNALPLLNRALGSPETAISDSTLLAVLLLDLFEKITTRDHLSSASWMSHVNGALMLIKTRGNENFQNHVGLRLSVRLSINLLISCVAANAPVPPALAKLRSDIELLSNKDDPKWRVSGLVSKYANLRGAMQDGCLLGTDIVTRAKELDDEFLALAQSMPLTWLYETIYVTEANDRVFEQHFDKYMDRYTTQTWNVVRLMRILLNDIIRSYCRNETSRSAEVITATNTIDDLTKQICASVPQYTCPEIVTPKTETNPETRNFDCYTLLFPLYVAAVYASSTTGVKPWIIKQLHFIRDEIGIRNAGLVADTLIRDDGTSIWTLYAMLGSYAFAA